MKTSFVAPPLPLLSRWFNASRNGSMNTDSLFALSLFSPERCLALFVSNAAASSVLPSRFDSGGNTPQLDGYLARYDRLRTVFKPHTTSSFVSAPRPRS
jgi:hypothetical protein